MPRHPLTSSTAACCWIPLFALRCEEGRRPELASQPAALLAPDIARRLWQVSPLGRHAGVKPGMTVSQAIGLCPSLRLCEPDPVYYDEQFARRLAALREVSPVVEPAELGRAYVGTDGLEGLYGAPEGIVEVIKRGTRNAERGTEAGRSLACSAFPLPRSAFRVGWGKGKFVSWVAATRARPGEAVIVRPGEEAPFLSAQPLAVLPLDPDTHRRLRQLGLKTLGRLAALPEEAVVSQFGGAGRRLWQPAAGVAVEPVGFASRGRSGPGSSRRHPRGRWSGSPSNSPRSRRAPPICSSSHATRAPPRVPAGVARSAARSRRSSSGSNARCSITSSRCS